MLRALRLTGSLSKVNMATDQSLLDQTLDKTMIVNSKFILYQYNVHVLGEAHLEFSANTSIIKLYLVLKLHVIVIIFLL